MSAAVVLPAPEIGRGALLQLRGDGRQDHGRPLKREVPCGLYSQRGVNATGLRQGPTECRIEQIIRGGSPSGA